MEHDRTHGRLMWVMMLGCCLVPIALLIAGVSVGTLAGARPWLLAAAAVLAVVMVIVHRVSGEPGCAPTRESEHETRVAP